MEDIEHLFKEKKAYDTEAHISISEKSHGRLEMRECWVSSELDRIRDKARWDGLKSVAKITCTRTIKEKTSKETRYFISSLKSDATEMLRVVRAHWAVENSLHWSLDISFREDESRVRIGHAGQNLALVRKLALNMLRVEKTAKGGVKAKRLQAGWSQEYLCTVLGICGEVNA